DASEGNLEPVAPADVDEGAEEDDDLIVNDGGSITLIDESGWNENGEDDGGYKEEESGHVGARNVKRDELTLDIVQGDDLTSTLNADVEHEYDPRLDLSNYQFPSHALLEDYRDKWYEVSRDELEQNKNKIVKTLANYKVSVARIEARRGPTVTLYRIHLSDGIRIATVKRLEEDIAMSLGAKGVRVLVLADAIGIEVANQKPSVVPLKMVLNSPQFVEASATMELPVAIGITVTNEPFYFDLAKMPHLLIAGATGTGKSVGLNTLITSLLYTKHPAEMKFVMVDPKKVELDFYEKLEKHYLAMLPDAEESIITDTKKVIHTLRSLCIEMDARYDLLRSAGVRKITEYNAKFLRRKLSPAKGHKYLPYIVVIIDEFADLITTAGREIEEPIARLAQKARAVG
ncbi:MAG: DEAD/DEAH box helicase family protein, partial [Bacteroidales bacterium]|nr:DEAD/DEAH box helicase family protein [Bacteroidales bacterium]